MGRTQGRRGPRAGHPGRPRARRRQRQRARRAEGAILRRRDSLPHHRHQRPHRTCGGEMAGDHGAPSVAAEAPEDDRCPARPLVDEGAAPSGGCRRDTEGTALREGEREVHEDVHRREHLAWRSFQPRCRPADLQLRGRPADHQLHEADWRDVLLRGERADRRPVAEVPRAPCAAPRERPDAAGRAAARTPPQLAPVRRDAVDYREQQGRREFGPRDHEDVPLGGPQQVLAADRGRGPAPWVRGGGSALRERAAGGEPHAGRPRRLVVREGACEEIQH
mmetsp:Transcript_18711/g.52911  ORF Transcript_18711/g.52911 Transcript_18711/m.52911 type:complete len:278 (-) Transcript_18711:1565-2398(-)